ncbi:MAG: magnesium transporter [Alphaproteobacteria bacterium]|nr:magnesium transporter [Alphaproteobacteria bacterium]MBE8220436.1 magnesium transporter [Alphaproteobacteria bacterium]
MSNPPDNPLDAPLPEVETSPLLTDSVTPERLEKISALVAGGAKDAVLAELEGEHEADIAKIIGLLPYNHRAEMMRLIGDSLPAEVFAELEDNIRDEVVEFLDLDTLVSTVQELDSDEAVFVLEDMDEAEREEVLQQIPAPERLVLQRSLDFPEESAGRLMRSEYVAVPPDWSVGQTIDYLRESKDLPEEFLEIFIIDTNYKPLGVVYPSEVLRTNRDVGMQSLIDEDFTLIAADMDEEEIGLLFERYNLLSVGVIDEAGRLLGVVTADDVFEVITQTAGEDILHLGGVKADSFTHTIGESVRGRFSWLFLNLLTAVFASIVIGWFDASIEKMVALAVLMPIVASMGGNAGTQTLTIAVRSLSQKDLQMVDARRVILRELRIGLLNGTLFAIVVAVLGYVWFGSVALGAVLGAAMIVTLVAAALAGILIPLGLHKFEIDPAIASGVFVTTITDVVGFFVFLGFATLFLL